jgi:UV DNA damage endonuclease
MKQDRSEQMVRLSALCLANARALVSALHEVRRLGIGAFRVSSPLFPLYTHPLVGYQLRELPDCAEICALLAQVKTLKEQYQIRLSFHPDQFTLLSSPRPEVTVAALKDLHYQALLASLIGADLINIHGGGVYGDKPQALARLAEQISALPDEIRGRLTLENDDQSYSVKDLEPLCTQLSVPLVYDVHHHRCNPDGLSIAQATEVCLQSWQRVGREPYFHISSPKYGWEGKLRPHADYIVREDFPLEWLSLDATLDVEAKAKELAVRKLQEDFNLPLWPPGETTQT